MNDPRFQTALDRHALLAFILAILSTVFTFTVRQSTYPAWSPLWILWGVIYTCSRWFWVVGILGLGHHFLNATNRILRYANEAAFPFYILHYPVITLVGYLLLSWNAAVAVKYSVIVVLTIAVTLVLFQVLIRHFNPLRFLFGMKPVEAKHPGSVSSSLPG
jgi:peptidoglycan/LPS O-acetylase OafA/YrhL